MFSKIKHLKDMRNQAKTLENSLAEKSVTIERGGITLTMDGNQKVTALTIKPDLTPSEIEKIIPRLLEDANDKVKRIMAETFQSMGGLNFPGM